jgi:hypothetical protein
MGMSHEDIQDLLGVYALDAVDRETAALVEEHLEVCPKCSIEVAQHHEVAGLLANSGSTAPASLWDSIAGQLSGTSDQSWDRLSARLDGHGTERDLGTGQDGHDGRDGHDGSALASVPSSTADGGSAGARNTVVDIGSARRRRPLSIGAGLVAAAAAVIALVFGVQVHHLNGRVSALQGQSRLGAAERAALAAPTTRKIDLTATGPNGAVTTPASVVLTASGTGFVVNESGVGLAPLPSDRTYQLWGVVGTRTISLGLLGRRPAIVPFSVAGTVPVTAFAITEEVAGGVVSSANPAVAAGSVPV